MSLGDMTPVQCVVTWGPQDVERAGTTMIRKVYLYRNPQDWLMVVAKG